MIDSERMSVEREAEFREKVRDGYISATRSYVERMATELLRELDAVREERNEAWAELTEAYKEMGVNRVVPKPESLGSYSGMNMITTRDGRVR